MRYWPNPGLVWLTLVLLISCSSPVAELTQDAPSILIFSRTSEYRHENIEEGLEILEREGKRRGIRVTSTDDPAIFRRDELSGYRSIVFFNTTGDVLDPDQQMEFERYIQAGGSFVGIHSAADTEWRENAWPWYTRLVGAAFKSHPNEPSNIQEATVRLADPNHPATANLPESWQREDEWYDYQRVSPEIDVLLHVDESTYEGGVSGTNHPIAWYREFDGGRSFYTGMGHTLESFEEDLFLDHLFGGIRWAMGGEKGPPELDYGKSAPHRWRLMHEVIAEGIGEPIAMDFAPNGDLYLVERRGRIRWWSSTSRKLSEVAQLDVYSVSENGLIGITFAPDYEDTGHAYLYFAKDSAGAPRYRLSRFELRDGKLDRETEEIILEVPIDYGATGHEGGDLQFDSSGNLWISTGDDSDPQGIDGYAPLDENPRRQIQNALRSAANSQDLRGKILRIHPEADGTYTIPEGNLFRDSSQGRPEIFAMGLRNPFRFSWDERTGVLYWGEIGPDANEDDSERGPRGYDEVNRTQDPGFFGWPLFIAENLPYRPWNFSEGKPEGSFFDPANPRNDSESNLGLRELPLPRPAWIAYPYDLDETFFELSWSGVNSRQRRGGRSALAGPVYYSEDYENTDARLPKYYDGKLFLYDFMRDWVMLVEQDTDGGVRKIEPFIDVALTAPIDLAIAPDGSVWLLEYGSIWFTDNEDSRLSRVSYFSGDNPPPVAVASVHPTVAAAPANIRLDASKSFDRNPDDELSWSWELIDKNGTRTSMGNSEIAEFTIEEPGQYSVELTVADTDGGKATARQKLKIGNDPPQILFRLDGNQTFFGDHVLRYRVEVTDTEDGSLAAGTIGDEDVYLEFIHSGSGFESTATTGGSAAVDTRLGDHGCTSCHALESASAGPSLREIADRYATDTAAGEILPARVISGGSGRWGGRDMPANSHLSAETARSLVDAILSLSSSRSRARTMPLEGEISFNEHSSSVETSFFGERSQAEYKLVATYGDRGAAGVGSLQTKAELLFRHPNIPAIDFDASHGVLAVATPNSASALIPDGLAGEALLLGLQDRAYAAYRGLDLTGIDRVRIGASALAAFMEGGVVEVHLGSTDGPLIGKGRVEATLLPSIANLDVDLSDIEGLQDVFLVFREFPENTEDDQPLLAVTNLDFAAKVESD